jgi:hypothetical protein
MYKACQKRLWQTGLIGGFPEKTGYADYLTFRMMGGNPNSWPY